MLGYSRKELERLAIWDIDSSMSRTEWENHFNHVQRKKTAVVYAIHRTRSGDEIPFELHSSAFSHDHQAYNVIFAHDISSRRRAEEHLADLARFPSENPNPVLRVSAEGTILYANAAAGELLKGAGN